MIRFLVRKFFLKFNILNPRAPSIMYGQMPYDLWMRAKDQGVESDKAWHQAIWNFQSPPPRILIVVLGGENSDSRASIENQTFKNVEIVSTTPSSLRSALGSAMADLVVFLESGNTLSRDALFHLAMADRIYQSDIVYGDEDVFSSGKYSNPVFRPAWSPEYFEGAVRNVGPLCVRLSLLKDLPIDFESKTWAHDLVKSAMKTGATVKHLRQTLLHRQAPVKETPISAKNKVVGNPLVTIAIPTNDTVKVVNGRGEVRYIANLIQSIYAKSTYRNFELLLVDNANLSPESGRQLEGIPFRHISYKVGAGGFNFANKINFCFQHAKGDYFIVMNDDMEIRSPDWIEQLLGLAQNKEIGVVGARLMHVNNTVEHGGCMFSRTGEVMHRDSLEPENRLSQDGRLEEIKTMSAVTGACTMIRREVWEELKGYDEAFAVDFNDIDFCLRVGQKGYRVVYNPNCVLTHFHQGTLSNRVQSKAERNLFRTRWDGVIQNDPYTNRPTLHLI